MAFEYSISNRKNHLHVIARGLRTRESLFKMASETLGECRRQDIPNVLLDIRQLQPRLSVFESTLLMTRDLQSLAHEGVLSKLAVVDIAQNLERLEFFEKMAKTRGVNITAFGNPVEAERWLADRLETVHQ